MKYDEIANLGSDGASRMEIKAADILYSIMRYGGFDMAWETTNYREEIFRDLVERLERIQSEKSK